jgi:hypothetical protein
MKTLEQWVDNYASETLHAWGLKGYTNLLDELKKALMFAVKEAPRMPDQPTTPKPCCDAQGRLLSAPTEKGIYYWVNDARVYSERGPILDNELLDIGAYFISQPAAEAELIRLKCLQRLRGMEGFTPYGGQVILIGACYVLDGFDTEEQHDAAKATITPEERTAFLYREPTKE